MTTSAREPQRIVLTGFMGCGKTTVGRILAGQLHWPFADLDDVVSHKAGQTVPEIFATSGEPAFREMECEALRDLLTGERLVISLGGGAVETAAVRSLLLASSHTAVLHLRAPLSVLLQRCRAQALLPDATARPLLGAPLDAEARYLRREPFYKEAAHHTVNACASPEAVAAEIIQTLGL